MPEDIMGRFMITVYCRAEGPHEARDGQRGCDGMFCTCWCHIPGDREGWRMGSLRGRYLASLPVGVL